MNGDALTSKERIKDRLQIVAATFDSTLDNMILAVTSRIEQMTNRRFIAAAFTNELHNGSDMYGTRRTSLIVKNAPLQALTAIEYDNGQIGSPDWQAFDIGEYIVNSQEGIIHFPYGLPAGFQNVRLTYTGGYSGFAIGVSAFWHFNVTPTGAVDSNNLTFTLPENADQVIVYPDGTREQSANVTHVDGTNVFTLADGRAPYSTIAVDYLAAAGDTNTDNTLPADLVEVAEVAVIRMFKRRDSEGRTSETFKDSSITWSKSIFTDEDMATIRSYKRGYFL